jgi:hypothetical protein
MKTHNHICRYCGKKYECSEEHDYFENSDYDCRWYTIATCDECSDKDKNL